MKCGFIDDRLEFFAILNEKLGEEFSLEPASVEKPEHLLGCEVLIVGLPLSEDASFSSCLATLQRLARNRYGIPIVAFLSTPDRQAIRTATAAGAYDYFVQTGSMEELRFILRRAADFHQLSRELDELKTSPYDDFVGIIGTDEKIRAVFVFASKVAHTDATVLITGETGTGKELFARAIHRASPRARHPFLAVACSSMPESLIEAELFGHERGAFTGAAACRKGRFEAAEQGTLFLDEIGELTPGLQVKLLRVLQERTFERLGSNQPRRFEGRVICATNCDLNTRIKAGKFRSDLLYRLNTIELRLPALRERRGDVMLLAHCFLQTAAERHRRPAQRINRAAMAALHEYNWPGNVREVQNVMEHAAIVCDGAEVQMRHLPPQFSGWSEEVYAATFDDEVKAFKRRLIQRVLVECNNNKVQAARSLRIARSSLHRLIEDLQVEIPIHLPPKLDPAASPNESAMPSLVETFPTDLGNLAARKFAA